MQRITWLLLRSLVDAEGLHLGRLHLARAQQVLKQLCDCIPMLLPITHTPVRKCWQPGFACNAKGRRKGTNAKHWPFFVVLLAVEDSRVLSVLVRAIARIVQSHARLRTQSVQHGIARDLLPELARNRLATEVIRDTCDRERKDAIEQIRQLTLAIELRFPVNQHSHCAIRQ